MTSRLREEERNERTIRNLLKLPENRRCINCNSLGPQYVCTNFWTFVCTICSGIHREFTHRVKSVSMAKFTSQEVSALQGGGNASAKEIYFKEWDTQRQSLPDSSNVERLRDFIKRVYVDRRYAGETSFDKPQRLKIGEAEDSYQGGRSDDRSSRNAYDERRSPGYDQNSQRSPPATRADTVNDWRREDRFNDGKIAVDGKFPDGDLKVVSKSPDRLKVPDTSSPPVVRPLRVIEPPKADGRRQSDGFLSMQRTVSSSSLATSNRNPAEHRTESSLIDFDAVLEPPSTAQVPVLRHTAPSISPSVTQPTSSSHNNNWANFDSAQEVKASHAPSNTNFIDVLSDLSVPVSAPISHSSITPGGAQAEAPGPNAFAKKELHADFFTSNYSPFAAAPGPGWFPAPQYGMGYNMQYNVPAPMPPGYLQPSRPSNPFDIHESSPVQTATFPSMAPLQGALPNTLPPSALHRTSSLGVLSPQWMPSHQLPSSIQRTSSLGNPSPAWMPIQSSHPSSMSTQGPSYGSGIPSGQYMVQGAPNTPPPPRPQVGGYGLDNTSFGSFNLNQQPSSGGNPFG